LSTSALAGVRVLELARVLAGPTTGQTLADLGADVIKVESPEGDETRAWGPPFIETEGKLSAAYFHSCNRGKRSIVADFTTERGREIVRRLAARADVLIENFKVGGLRKFGLDYESLKALNPRLIYCSVTGFGQTGPYAKRAGYDFLIQGMSGVMSITGEPDGSPQKAGIAISDLFTGLYGVIAMIIMIVCLDQFLWRPLVVWGQKFRVEEGGAEEGMSSWFLDFIYRSQIIQFFQGLFKSKQINSTAAMPPEDKAAAPGAAHAKSGDDHLIKIFSIAAFVCLLGLMLFGAWKIIELFRNVSLDQWKLIVLEALATLGRVLVAVVLSAIWTIPVGLWLGLSPRLSRIAQPFVQVAASFPAPMLFSYVILVMHFLGIPLNWGAIALMILGAQWYILFNVMAGAMAIPSDLLEAARMYRITGWQRFTKVYLPGIFPYLVTGMVTSAGGTWNASIVAEYVTDKGQTLTAFGLGSQISEAAAKADFPMLAASVVVMSLMVVTFNRLVWKRLYRLAEEKYSLSK